MTHRHADHIAGFSRAERFKDFTARMVWMPYWEQFNDAKDSPHNLQFDLGELASQLAMQFRGRTDEVAQEAFAQLERMRRASISTPLQQPKRKRVEMQQP